MGTSVSQRSPSTRPWRAVQAAYTSSEVPVERVVQEIWRAATSQPEESLPADLSAAIVAECLKITMTASSRAEAVQEAARAVAFSEESSLAADIAQRAVARSFSVPGSRPAAFTRAIFAEAGDYLVSRDLPGLVGASERMKTLDDAIAFKDRIREEIVEVVEVVELPDGIDAPAKWSEYVEQVVDRLQRAA
jgi:hypothetical protein